MALPIARRGTVRVVPYLVPCTSADVQKTSTTKTKVKSTVQERLQVFLPIVHFFTRSPQSELAAGMFVHSLESRYVFCDQYHED